MTPLFAADADLRELYGAPHIDEVMKRATDSLALWQAKKLDEVCGIAIQEVAGVEPTLVDIKSNARWLIYPGEPDWRYLEWRGSVILGIGPLETKMEDGKISVSQPMKKLTPNPARASAPASGVPASA